MSETRLWTLLVLCYWLVMSVIVTLETTYMKADWAGLPGFILSLPLSVFVVTGYFLARYATEVYGYHLDVTEFHAEYGFLFCAFINGFIFYPIYRWWLARRKSRVFEAPPTPPDFKT
jgi:hypothetical protein